MKLSFETFDETKLAVIPFYPLAHWNEAGAKRKTGGKANAPTFNKMMLELQRNPENAGSFKVGAIFEEFEN